MKRIAILHFQPLQLYPPAQNLIRLLGPYSNYAFRVHTSAGPSKKKIFTGNHIRVKEWGAMDGSASSLKRLWHYFRFNIGSILHLFYWRPHTVMYYESYSAFPAIVYQFFFRRTNLLIHYHEYHEVSWYDEGMKTVKWFHQLEKKIAYPRAKWISQTNAERLKMFLDDNQLVADTVKYFVFPNYPPQSWIRTSNRTSSCNPARLVYIGSFSSMDTLYIKEFLEWVSSCGEKMTLDIYCFSVPQAIKQFVETLNSKSIQLKGPIDYDQIPAILEHYDVGVILYKGSAKNTVYSVSNKLFEYLSCGLDVWYPAEITGTYPYDSPVYWPKVLRLDFRNLYQYNLSNLLERRQGFDRQVRYTCEAASAPLLEKLLE